MDVSIIIVSYNTKNLLSDCIRSVMEKTEGVDYEIIVVDNDSADGTMAMLEEEFPEVKAIASGSNLGFGRANNIGMQAAAGKYLFLLNSDTLLNNNAVKIFFDKAEDLKSGGRKIGTLGSILRAPSGKTCHSYGYFLTPGKELKEVLAKYMRWTKDPENTEPKEVSDIKAVDYVTGADMFLPREVFEITGGFDPDFFMYCEEVDWQKRMAEQGYERMLIEGPKIIHLEGGGDPSETRSWSVTRLHNIYKSRKIYRQKHYLRWILPLFSIIYKMTIFPSFAISALRHKDERYLRLLKF